MKKRTAYVMLLIVCLCFFSFRKKCNNVNHETSLKQGCTEKIIQVQSQEEWSTSPLYNLLVI